MIDHLAERLNLAFPMMLGLAYLWATLTLPTLVSLLRSTLAGCRRKR